MNGTHDETEEPFDDIEIEVPGSGDQEPIDAGTHIARCVGWKVEDKPQWKLEQQKLANPDREPDPRQWAITFEISEGDFAGRRLTTWENRSWHERANAAKIAAALLGLERLEPDGNRNVRDLMNAPAQILVIEKGGKNYIHGVLPLPKRRRSAPAAPQAPEPAQADVLGLQGRFEAAYREYTEMHSAHQAKDAYLKLVPKGNKFATLTAPEQVRVVEWLEAQTGGLEF